ncbi:MAG: hypothetical protein ILP17_12980, partial [Lachnospiraceae bacterium]|nr:hypothetical protein [Lachnospiraceae bacterium]
FIRLLYSAKEELDFAVENFNFITDKHLMDYYIFRISAAERRLNYFIMQAVPLQQLCKLNAIFSK